jgi:hypothetical protein
MCRQITRDPIELTSINGGRVTNAQRQATHCATHVPSRQKRGQGPLVWRI